MLGHSLLQFPQIYVFLIVKEVDFYAKFRSKMAKEWRELAPFIFRATATTPFFTLAPQRRAPPFTVRASGAVARWR